MKREFSPLLEENVVPLAQSLKTMAIGEILAQYPQTQPVFEQYGLLNYAKTETARYENLHASALVHALDVENILTSLVKAIEN